ncbi:hypothetical protein BN14_10636 [Rhizoctonia solani AG-1 IB]|uniref:Stalled ribosome sensor GCN1-like N-terminal domain-containing protein n=1 Tax=Thanatephorus cucumeris (strain AG1-IB / isolate 7/3/14) TaxID=1108050 RepID=M5CBN1_THACB|nr:hypothetical protein BN14_10636 [Rhizoctonia solani AG-1 IB]
MSKAEIHSWITTAQHEDASDDGQDTVDIASATINEEEDWVQFMLIAQRRLLGDGTRGRIEFLKEQLGVVANRGGVFQASSTLNHFVLLTWIAAAFTACAKSDLFPTAKTFRVVNHALIPTVADTLFETAKTASAPLNYAVLIGVAVDVSLRLRPSKANEQSPGATYVSLVKENALAYYLNHVVLAKSAVPDYISRSFHDLVQNCVTEDDLTNTVIPTAEKAILRSPEVSLHVLSYFFSSLPYPLPPALFTRIFTPVLNATKSTNPLARSGSVRVVKSLLAPPTPKAKLPGSPPDTIPTTNSEEIYAQNVEAARDLILAPLQTARTSSADHRTTLLTISSVLPESKGKTAGVLSSVVPSVAKDGKEDGWPPLGALLKGASSIDIL